MEERRWGTDYAVYKDRFEPENDAAAKDGNRYGFTVATVPRVLIYKRGGPFPIIKVGHSLLTNTALLQD